MGRIISQDGNSQKLVCIMRAGNGDQYIPNSFNFLELHVQVASILTIKGNKEYAYLQKDQKTATNKLKRLKMQNRELNTRSITRVLSFIPVKKIKKKIYRKISQENSKAGKDSINISMENKIQRLLLDLGKQEQKCKEDTKSSPVSKASSINFLSLSAIQTKA